MSIWQNRVLKEYSLLSTEGDIEVPGGKVKLLEHSLDTDSGICCLEFYFELVCWTGCCTFDCGKQTRYPFDPPKVRVTDGFADLPPHMTSDGPLLQLTSLSGQWTPGQTIRTSIIVIAQVAGNRGPEETLVPRMDSGKTYIAGDVLASRSIPKDNIFPCSVETVDAASSNVTKRNIIAVITATQLLETCWEGGAGLLPHAIGPFTHGNLVVLHCVPLTDLRKLTLTNGKSVTVESVRGESATQTYCMSRVHQFASAVNARFEELKANSDKAASAITKHTERARAAHQEAERTLKLVESSATIHGINHVMDLCRQTTELYSAISDDRSQEVVDLLHAFLKTPAISALIESREEPLQPTPQPSLRDREDCVGGGGGDNGNAVLTEQPSLLIEEEGNFPSTEKLHSNENIGGDDTPKQQQQSSLLQDHDGLDDDVALQISSAVDLSTTTTGELPEETKVTVENRQEGAVEPIIGHSSSESGRPGQGD